MIGPIVGASFGIGVLVAVRGWQAGGPPPPLLAALSRVPAFAPPPRDRAWGEALRPAMELALRLIGGRRALQRRLVLAGDDSSVDSYLMGQVMRAGGFAAAALALVIASGSAARPGPAVVLLALSVVGGLLLGDQLLTRRIAARREGIAEQFPVAAQLLALLIAAGVPPSDAVGRVGRAIGGPLGQQLTDAAHRSAAGQGFAAAMREFAAACDLPVIERFVFGLLSAIERGSPLAEIMRAQAMDAAAESHRALMTSAGRRDIAMLVPVVFAVLPTVVMVSLLPGAVQLGLIGG